MRQAAPIDLDELDRACRNLLWLIAWRRSADHVAKADPALGEHHERYLADFVNDAIKHWANLPLAKAGKYVIHAEDIALCELHKDIAAVLEQFKESDINKTAAICSINVLIKRWLASGPSNQASVNPSMVRRLWNRFEKESPTKIWVIDKRGPLAAAAELLNGIGATGARKLFILRKVHKSEEKPYALLVPSAHGGRLSRSMVQDYAMRVVRFPEHVISDAMEKGEFLGELSDEVEPDLQEIRYYYVP